VSVELARPIWLVLLGVLPLWWWWVRPRKTWALVIAHGEESGAVALQPLLGRVIEAAPRSLRGVAIVCLILALSHPQWVRLHQERVNDGPGIAFAIDLSTSMRAQDMAEGTSRLQAAKAAIQRFLPERAAAVGVVAFAGEALTRLPLTYDRYVVESTVGALEVGLLTDGTDIAGAIAAAAGLLRDAPHRPKAVILVTDGAHNKTGLEPARAAAAAAAYGVRVYAIALGGNNGSDESVETGTSDVETVLTQAARISGGKYFHATDVAALDRSYTEIDALAAVPSVRSIERKAVTPVAPWLLLASLVLLSAGMTLRASRWGVIP
jgi:Ca-activated chloride channel homolog